MTASAEFDTAIVSYSTNAKALFVAGDDYLRLPGPSIPTDIPEKDRLARAQGYLSAGFSQLGQAAQMQSTQSDREGRAAVVDLMKSTATCAAMICQKIQGTVNASGGPDYSLLTALNETLKALASLSPASVWAGTTST